MHVYKKKCIGRTWFCPSGIDWIVVCYSCDYCATQIHILRL